jgi:hypothetical protein
MTFTDFGYSLLTDSQAAFAASKYKVVSLEKCTGRAQGVKTEKGIYQTARQLKKINPDLKVIFYWATDTGGISCYAANSTYMSHPEWWLKDDSGAIVGGASKPMIDWQNAEARDWWVSIPLKGDGDGTFEGQPVSELIDGVLADGSGFSTLGLAAGKISVARLESLADAHSAMVGAMQQACTKLNDGLVMANGISMYASQEDPRNADHHLSLLGVAGSVMNEHLAVFESVNHANASLNVETVSRNLDAIAAAAAMHNGTRSVFVSTWPGFFVGFGARGQPMYPPVAQGGEVTPTTNDEWRDALRRHFDFAFALFLIVAEANTWFNYAGVWYELHQGYVTCPEAPESCMAPPEWYPKLDLPLGAPLGARKATGEYKWAREFAHATVAVDLSDPKECAVTFRK